MCFQGRRVQQSRHQLGCLLFVSHYELIRYESSRGHKIDGTKQTGNAFGEKKNRESRQKETGKKVASIGHRTPVLSTCLLHTNSGCGKERRIIIGPP